MENQLLGPQQIIKAFDEHMEQFKWRLSYLQRDVELEAYRQLVSTLQHEINSNKHMIQKLEYVLKKMGIDPRQSQFWSQKEDNND